MPRIPRPGRRSPDETVDPPANAATEPQSTATAVGEGEAGGAVNGDATPAAPPPPAEPPTAALAAPASAAAAAPAAAAGDAPDPAGSDGDAVPAGQEPASPDAGFGHRGQLRRRLRFLRRARELGLRDLGGLVFDMQRFGRPREDLVAGKVATLTRIDGELRSLEAALNDVQPVTVLREPGITACPVCSAINATDANFCSNCGLPRSQRRDREPVAAPRFGSAGAPPALGAPAGGAAGPSAGGSEAAPAAAGPAAAGAAGAADGADAPAPGGGGAPEAPTATFAATPAPVGPASSEKPDDEQPQGEAPGEPPGQAPPEPSSS